MKECLYATTEPTTYVILKPGHRLHGMVLECVPVFHSHDGERSLTRSEQLVPVQRLEGDRLTQAETVVAKYHKRYLRSGACECPECYVARTNYPQ